MLFMLYRFLTITLKWNRKQMWWRWENIEGKEEGGNDKWHTPLSSKREVWLQADKIHSLTAKSTSVICGTCEIQLWLTDPRLIGSYFVKNITFTRDNKVKKKRKKKCFASTDMHTWTLSNMFNVCLNRAQATTETKLFTETQMCKTPRVVTSQWHCAL